MIWTRNTRKKRKTSGSRRSARVAGVLVLLAAVALAAGQGSQPKERYAVIAGTVFREPGLALAGAEVTAVAEPEGEAAARGAKKHKAVSDGRGEFLIRVPAGPMRYNVGVRAKGYQPQEKSVTVGADERVDVFFLLAAEANPSGEASR